MLTNLIKITAILFVVIDIIGVIPVILSMNYNKINPLKITIYGTILTIIFTVFGNNILSIFGINQNSLSIAGGIILFIISMEMLLDRDIFKTTHSKNTDLIFPIAFPLLYGAGTLATVTALALSYGYIITIIGIIINSLFIYFILKKLNWIDKNINSEILFLIKKIFAIFVLSTSINLIVKSIKLL